MSLLFTLLNVLLCATTISAADNSSTMSTSETVFYSNLSDVILLDVSSHGFWNSNIVTISPNDTAVNNYYDCLVKGWFGQAIRERYAFDGQVLDNGTVNSTDMVIDDLILSDLQDYLDEDDYRISDSKVAFEEALNWNATDCTTDPGRELLEKIFTVLQNYNPLVKREAYTTHCKKRDRALYGQCELLWDDLPTGTTAIATDRIEAYGTCYAKAPGSKFMSKNQFKAEVGLIIEDCTYCLSTCGYSYVQGHIPHSSSRRKVCVQRRTTNC